MARIPVTGWGWNRAVSVYEHGHQPVWLSESAAVTLNDYFMVGMSLGVLAVWAFSLWIWLAWQPTTVAMPATPNSQFSTCLLPKAALFPLLTSLALDGGLFKVGVAIPFCVLTQLAADSEFRDSKNYPLPA